MLLRKRKLNGKLLLLLYCFFINAKSVSFKRKMHMVEIKQSGKAVFPLRMITKGRKEEREEGREEQMNEMKENVTRKHRNRVEEEVRGRGRE